MEERKATSRKRCFHLHLSLTYYLLLSELNKVAYYQMAASIRVINMRTSVACSSHECNSVFCFLSFDILIRIIQSDNVFKLVRKTKG